ncbi:MAG: DeoR/GlpR transcriptional regulator [Deltaproteobacteria bacterium]|jgi:DeoR family transcriptional regulator, ulaG and ulaABCDEF operon transcriptional repressor|nr:DeoR/GlpR transcriptional regulator [Deltaproteobacteria bacterium]
MKERERQEKILNLLKNSRFLSNAKMMELLDVSEATIRRDLSKLAKQGLIRRLRGGAETLEGFIRTRPAWEPFKTINIINIEEKKRIAQKAAELCTPGESIIIDGGTTTNLMVEFLKDTDLQILTNALHTAVDLIKNTNNRVILPGGEVFREQKVIVSPFENDTIQQYSASKLFMATQGITQVGLTQWDSLLIRAQQKLMNQAEHIIILADSSKFNQRGSLILCPLKRIDTVITDSGIDQESVKMLEGEHIELIIV